jgi:hypothetical protein
MIIFYFFPKLVLLPLKALMLIASFAEGAGVRARAGATWLPLPLDENFKPRRVHGRKALMVWRVVVKVILYFNKYYYF